MEAGCKQSFEVSGDCDRLYPYNYSVLLNPWSWLINVETEVSARMRYYCTSTRRVGSHTVPLFGYDASLCVVLQVNQIAQREPWSCYTRPPLRICS